MSSGAMSLVSVILVLVSAGAVFLLDVLFEEEWERSWTSRVVLCFGIGLPLTFLVAVSWWLIIVVVVSFVASTVLVVLFEWEWPLWIATYVGLNVLLTIVAGLFVFALGIFSL